MTAPRLTRTTVLLIAVSLASIPAVNAADCIRIPRTTAEDVAVYSVVFVGDVTDVVVQQSLGLLRVTFDVLEAYKGGRAGSQTLSFIGSTEAPITFARGQRVLVFATRNPDPDVPGVQYEISCSPTRLVTLDDPAITELRRLAKRRR